MRLATRDDFDPVFVRGLLERAKLSRKQALEILEEACYVIAELQDQEKFQEYLEPWRRTWEEK